jgi:NAD(P)-dependent dehydrogenase (short-subunit alcohol dehydrogenase family)
MKGLKEKKVLITGGASGIGKATVQRFLEEGSKVAVVDNNREACKELQSEFPDLESEIVADVSDSAAVKAAFRTLDSVLGTPDVVINNAGISIRHHFNEIETEEWLRVLDVNLNGVFFVAREAARRMLKARGGVIINMGSTNGIVGQPYYADYNASKAGVIELTRSMALELAPDIRVNAVCPGYVLTPMQEAEYTPEMIETVNNKIPLRRHASPSEVAALFAFLASDEACYITGQTLVIDGGETAGGLASR